MRYATQSMAKVVMQAQTQIQKKSPLIIGFHP